MKVKIKQYANYEDWILFDLKKWFLYSILAIRNKMDLQTSIPLKYCSANKNSSFSCSRFGLFMNGEILIAGIFTLNYIKRKKLP